MPKRSRTAPVRMWVSVAMFAAMWAVGTAEYRTVYAMGLLASAAFMVYCVASSYWRPPEM